MVISVVDYAVGDHGEGLVACGGELPTKRLRLVMREAKCITHIQQVTCIRLLWDYRTGVLRSNYSILIIVLDVRYLTERRRINVVLLLLRLLLVKLIIIIIFCVDQMLVV